MLISAFLIGLLGSWHCIGMCGPIALMIPNAKGKSRLWSILLYHGGKIMAYVIIGLLMGILTVAITSFKVQAIITIAVGVFMAILALTPLLLRKLEERGLHLYNPIRKIKQNIAQSSAKQKLEYSLYIGFFNGFIPCGMVYMAALGALVQESMLDTILFMVFFGIGTMPIMSAIIFSSNLLKSKFQRHANVFRTAAFMFLALFMIYRGGTNLHKEITQPKVGEDFMICH
ncbi:sulfite exporter TauE/SafE family protein [Crocinitomix catalasitica]|uniref:sulfite exporter TauE/SafE family protein n=1 Tax=Crocinitomix catalasitica TaxID=184607 RepID=UPI0009077392|nr:sulfite exporter TauE/SafE family protein [Crocinitomix catalasitica]